MTLNRHAPSFLRSFFSSSRCTLPSPGAAPVANLPKASSNFTVVNDMGLCFCISSHIIFSADATFMEFFCPFLQSNSSASFLFIECPLTSKTCVHSLVKAHVPHSPSSSSPLQFTLSSGAAFIHRLESVSPNTLLNVRISMTFSSAGLHSDFPSRI
uniref:Uncharacterized protein TCIL3000_10_2040 n=1 Tax=Trypanosoma congolense (strain IL3000) TaxID=1068625 RepID=G0UVM9_TRYCI|nr:unnamed protein product [Trypanosoma congolense IL3000]